MSASCCARLPCRRQQGSSPSSNQASSSSFTMMLLLGYSVTCSSNDGSLYSGLPALSKLWEFDTAGDRYQGRQDR